MRALLASLLALACVAASTDAGATAWSWEDLDPTGETASIAFTRQGSGPLMVTFVSAVASCSGRSVGSYDTSLGTGIAVRADGSFAYDGPAEELPDSDLLTPVHPTLRISGRVTPRTVTGIFRISLDGAPWTGYPCRAQSALVKFEASCTEGCPKVVTKPPPATVFPGVGIGGPGLGMRGVAKLGTTQAHVRALHRTKPSSSEGGSCGGGSRQRCDRLDYRYGNGARASYLLLPRLVRMTLTAGIRTPAGVTDLSSKDELLRAYPRIHCVSASGLQTCFLRRGSATSGTLTQFVLAPRLYAVAIYACKRYRAQCSQATGP